MKKILDKLKETNPERANEFQKKAQVFVKRVLDNFKDFDFYVSENGLELNGMILLKFYKEDGIIPYYYIFKDGIIEEKV